jgi:Zn-dependent M16 (insulinase) family peptidase
MFLCGKALTNQVDDLFDILKDLLFKVKFDNRERFKQIVLETKSALEQSIIPAGNRFVNLRINSHFNKAAWAEEQMGGVSSLFFLRELANKIDNDWQNVLGDLKEIYRILVSANNVIINATIDEKNWKKSRERVAVFSDNLPVINPASEDWLPVGQTEFEGLVIPAQVNYVGKGANLYNHNYSYNGSVNVITHFLRTGYLWDHVRVQGGAYGAMCQFNRMSGVFTLVSYRDPNLIKTLDIYDKAAAYLRKIEITETELQKSIIGVIGDIDSYMLPDAKGFTSLLRSLNGNSDEDRQIMRDQVLGTSAADFKAFADVLEKAGKNSIVKILGGRNALEEAYSGKQMPSLLKVL